MTSTTSSRAESDRYYREFGRRLARIRAARKIPDTEAAAKIGVTLPTYRRWEAGGKPRTPHHQGFVAFARKHGVTLKYLIA
jgi:transcriptional regulator with XRE-family HTH domain